MKFKDWTPVDKGKRLLIVGKCIKYYLTFKERNYECLCSRENRDRILNIKGGEPVQN